MRPPGIPARLFWASLCVAGVSESRPAGVPRSEQFLIVQRPERLVVMNRYQQTLTTGERSLLRTFVPMRIIRDRDVLGDGFTPCMAVEIDGQPYYLIRGKDGLLVGGRGAGSVRRVAGTVLGADTIRVLRGGVLRLTSPDGRGSRRLGRGERLVRFFASEGRTYVESAGMRPAFGWVALPSRSAGEDWGPVRSASREERVIPDRVRDSVQAVLDRANRILSDLFGFFNRQKGENRPVPRWQLRGSRDSLVCTLVGSSPEGEYPRSTALLTKDLESALPGANFEAIPSPGGIVIRRK